MKISYVVHFIVNTRFFDNFPQENFYNIEKSDFSQSHLHTISD